VYPNQPTDNSGAAGTDARASSAMSIFNPTDASMMAQDGTIDPNMTVDDFLKNVLKVDPQGPVTQLVDMYKQQSSMANPVNKMAAIAGGTQQRQPQAPAPGPQPMQGGGLRSLLGGGR